MTQKSDDEVVQEVEKFYEENTLWKPPHVPSKNVDPFDGKLLRTAPMLISEKDWADIVKWGKSDT